MDRSIYIGCAGWSLPKGSADQFVGDGPHLERYSQRFQAVEINSSFYRSHRVTTYQRWAAITPQTFRFAVKLPKEITHIRRLVNSELQIAQFARETAGLGDKLGVILVQLPPSLAFEPAVGDSFFRALSTEVSAVIMCEPRHPSWFSEEADLLLKANSVGRVVADPSLLPIAAMSGGCTQHAYFRWHGSPQMYYSAYDAAALHALQDRLINAMQAADTVWCIFDNTAGGAALPNALALSAMLHATLQSGPTI